MIAPPEERALIRRMVDGDERAFEEFCDLYLPPLYRFAQSRLRKDPELTREIVQSTLCKVIAGLDTYRGEAALLTWLCSCCRYEIAGYYRKQEKFERQVPLEEGAIFPETSSDPRRLSAPERDLLRSERADLVHLTLDRLPPHYARALEWKYLEGLQVKEIAARLSLGFKAAESLLTRARGSFQRTYSQLLDRAGESSRPFPAINQETGSAS